ncbi:MAG TPA: hypothetical protein VGO11_27990 [Chthoniobacteraceae bacterium]|nr:hypothetical protein [Chthoniobacteraceae bacterium]
MNRVLLDSVGILALCDIRDQWHEAATEAFARMLEEQAEVCTTTFVLAECGNALARTKFRQSIVDLRLRLEKENALINPSDADWHDAWTHYGSELSRRPRSGR